jgi:hypothetical protein
VIAFSQILLKLLDDTLCQASGQFDPSLVTEALRDIEDFDTPKQDTDLLKNVAAMAYMGQSTYFFSCFFFSANGAIPQGERIPQLQQLELSFWRWSAIPRYRRRLKLNLTKSSMEGFPNIAILFPSPISRRSLKKFIGMLQLISTIHFFTISTFLDGSL